MKKRTHSHAGYIFLFGVITMGVVALATVSSLLLISLGIVRSGDAIRSSQQAFFLAHTCAERALQSLWNDPGYGGGEHLVYLEGDCDILGIGGYGNENRFLCVEGHAGSTARGFQILLRRILPSIQVYSWQEVSSCPDAQP